MASTDSTQDKEVLEEPMTSDRGPGDPSTPPAGEATDQPGTENPPDGAETHDPRLDTPVSPLYDSANDEKILSLRRLVTKLKLAPMVEINVNKILRRKAQKAKEKQKQLEGGGSATNSKVMDGSNVAESDKQDGNTDPNVTRTESADSQALNKSMVSLVPNLKSTSSPHIYIADPNDKDDDSEDDFYIDEPPEEERPLKHAATMPHLFMPRCEKAFPAPFMQERETSFHKEIFLLQEYRDQRPSTAKRRASLTLKSLAKEAEADLKHSWLLDEQTRELWKKFEERKRALTIVVSDEDPMSAIEHRLEEVRMMSKPRKDMRHVLERLPEDQKENIIKVNQITSEYIRDERRKGFQRPCDRLRWAGKMISLLFRAIDARKRYYMDKNDEPQVQNRVENVSEVLAGENIKTSVGAELQTAMTTPPQQRDQPALKKILWLLRASRAFKHLFPAEMEVELARYVAYEKYDDGRIIATQGKSPDRFYYIVAGRVALLRQYKLTTGQVTKNMGYLTKGMTSDPAELERNWLREDSMVARGQVEVLLLDREIFSYLQHTTQGPPIDFLRSLVLFDEFPVEMFLTSSEAIEYGYYGQGKVIVEESNASPWLYVVKSGHVKVVRYQHVVDAQASNQSRFISPRVDDLGMGKSFSHANTMLGVQANQKKRKQRLHPDHKPEKLTLPKITQQNENLVSNPFGETIGAQAPPMMYDEEDGEMGEMGSSFPGAEQLTVPQTLPATTGDSNHRGARRSKRQKPDKGQTTNDSFLPQIKIAKQDGEDSSSVWLTKERTKLDRSPGTGAGTAGAGAGTGRKEPAERPAYLQLDLLTRGAVFGLKDVSAMYYKKQGIENMHQALSSDGPGVTLLSDGAEVIKINKRFFLHNAGNNTMLKVDTMYKEYMSEEEAKNLLYDRETWIQYKNALWTRMTERIPQSVLSNR